MQKRILIIISIFISILGILAIQSKRMSDRFASFQESQKSGTIISSWPNVEFKYLNSEQKYDFKKLDSGKKKLFLHFWATWCAPCEAEFPKLVDLIKETSSEDISFVFVAVNDEENKIKKFLKKFPDLNAQIVFDDEFIHQKHFGTYKLPETFIFNKDGSVLKKYSGAQNWTSEML